MLMKLVVRSFVIVVSSSNLFPPGRRDKSVSELIFGHSFAICVYHSFILFIHIRFTQPQNENARVFYLQKLEIKLDRQQT